MLVRSALLGDGSGGTERGESAAFTFTSDRLLESWFACGITRSKTALAIRDEARVRDPGAVEAVARLALLVGQHLGHRGLVGRWHRA